VGRKSFVVIAFAAACGGSSSDNPQHDSAGPTADGPTLGACAILPVNNIFNTPIDNLPVDPHSSDYLTTIGGTRKLHLDLGTQTDQQATDFYGIPWNTIHGGSEAWSTVAFMSTDPSLNWDPKPESDCGDAGHAVVSPCTAVSSPQFPIPANAVVEGGINSAANEMPYEDHHLLVVDVDACRLWEAYHVYSPASGTWNIFGAAEFDLTSNKLRPAGWTSADAAGFPIMPLLLKADEASSGAIHHALRFTIQSSKIRTAYVWPARHVTGNDTSATLPPMGQLFRLKADFAIPDSFNVQSKAILQAMKTYGMYIADGGSDWYVSGEPSASWMDSTFSEVQSVAGSNFEAVDITAITSRPGFDVDSGAVP
jgi:hypothetical protein